MSLAAPTELVGLTGGKGVMLASPVPADVAAVGYVEHELAAAGTATAYRAVGELSADGRWTFGPAGSAPYRTRVVVRRPVAAERFSGTAVVEWLNVSSGHDADVIWATNHEEITRRGHAWVGVSAQLIGVAGGPVLASPVEGADAPGLVGTDPERYGSLVHPGDGFAFDLFTQTARSVRDGTLLGGLTPRLVLAAGQSQSAYAMVTYVNGVEPLVRGLFDGYLLHSRGLGALNLAAPGQPAGLHALTATSPVLVREDTTTPVLIVQAEGDLNQVLHSLGSRQDDLEHVRTWEVAGAAHADQHTVGPFADLLGCGVDVNDAPMHVVVKAALRALETWARGGTPPPASPRITTAGGEIVRDGDGIALGGIRTPPVDVPVDVLSGIPGPNPSVICQLFGSTIALPAARVAELYPSRAHYLARYTAAVDRLVADGFALAEDREALLAYAQPDRIS
ncbi:MULTISPECIES: alpha/beta hydrolase domain-containing protein [Pseudofrankia]|uniref:alpha/beta hydrolase domain-containing protein n=1 Tax=Pseudofrankia TaxID=2994363 RepID=UPI000234D323|nr:MULTISPECIES: alpha/beta hydrolase domain-containing protein [Pseudofrankia]